MVHRCYVARRAKHRVRQRFFHHNHNVLLIKLIIMATHRLVIWSGVATAKLQKSIEPQRNWPKYLCFFLLISVAPVGHGIDGRFSSRWPVSPLGLMRSNDWFGIIASCGLRHVISRGKRKILEKPPVIYSRFRSNCVILQPKRKN